MAELMLKLLRYGGAIVRANDLSAAERKIAESRSAVFVDAEGNAFAWVGQSSLTVNKGASSG